MLGTIQHLRILEWRLMYNYVLHAIIVKWAKEEIDMFRRQVYSLNDQDEQTVAKCLRYARQHCSIVSHRNI